MRLAAHSQSVKSSPRSVLSRSEDTERIAFSTARPNEYPLSKQLTVKQTLLGWKRKRFQPNNIIYFNFNKIEKIHARGLNLL